MISRANKVEKSNKKGNNDTTKAESTEIAETEEQV